MPSPDTQPRETILLKLLAALGQSLEAAELAQAHGLAEETNVRIAAQAVRQAVKRFAGIESAPRFRPIKGGRG